MFFKTIERAKHSSQKLFTAHKKTLEFSQAKTIVVGKLNTPTFDYYFSKPIFGKEIERWDEADLWQHLLTGQRLDNFLLVLVRNVSIRLLKHLDGMLLSKTRVVWFMDDDIPGASLDYSLPTAYRRKLKLWYDKSAPILSRICNEVWVSTAHLAAKYSLPPEAVITPKPLKISKTDVEKCFYHGSGSHELEWKFLKSFITEVQNRYDHTYFELIGDHQLNKMFRDLPRVTIIHPMSWPNYQAHIASRSMDIGLAPLFESPFNKARSHTKFFDIHRQGAVGIFSKRYSIADMLEDSQAGYVSDDSLEDWLKNFDLAINANKKAMFDNATKCIELLS